MRRVISRRYHRLPMFSSNDRRLARQNKQQIMLSIRACSNAKAKAEEEEEKRIRKTMGERVLKSLEFERRKNFVNAIGRADRFANFAREQFQELSEREPSEKRKSEMRRLALFFKEYESFDFERRETGCADAKKVLMFEQGGVERADEDDASEGGNPYLRRTTAMKSEGKECEEGDDETARTRTKTTRETKFSKVAIGKSFIVDTPQWEHALREDQRRRRELAIVVEQKNVSSSGDDKATVMISSMGNTEKEEEETTTDDDESQKQGTDEWKALRATRLTASAFSNAVGFWREGRVSLWEEKLGIGIPFSGNDATEWGTKTEDEACEAYAALTNASVSHLLFRALSPDEAELWMGASPDGLVVAATTDAAEHTKNETSSNSRVRSGDEKGILEVKCPFNRGKPLDAKPYPKVPWYYVPQVQGLMAVFDRPWVDVFAYTVNNGCAIYRVKRDPEYWAEMYEALSDFWWQNVVPAKHAMQRGIDFEKYRPDEEHPKCKALKAKSQKIASESSTWVISKSDLEQIIAANRLRKAEMPSKQKEEENSTQTNNLLNLFDGSAIKDPSWRELLKDEFAKPYFANGLKEFLLQEFQNSKVFPPKDLIFNAFEKTPVERVKVVIVGQDPYHNDDQAMGLAFSVPKTLSLVPPSLKNIYKELKDDIEQESNDTVSTKFEIPKHGDLTNWAEQGVLLLNTSLTVRAHEANSHSGVGWETFTDRAIESLSQNTENVVFLLWGKYAETKERLICEGKNHFILKCAHPSPLSAPRGFFGCKHFSQTNEFLREVNREPIDWGRIL
jgi:uracil-DNA glycosylase